MDLFFNDCFLYMPGIYRLLDTFVTGPTQIYMSMHIDAIFLKIFMFVVGTLTILYNTYVYL